ELPAEKVHQELSRHAPPGLEILSVQPIAGKTTAHVRKVCYRIAIPAEREPGLQDAIAALLAAPTCWVEQSRPRPRRIDVRPFLSDVRLVRSEIEVEVFVTPKGTARPEDILNLL